MHTSIIFLDKNLAESNKAIYALSLFGKAIQQFDFLGIDTVDMPPTMHKIIHGSIDCNCETSEITQVIM